jgi:hypothetical protein
MKKLNIRIFLPCTTLMFLCFGFCSCAASPKPVLTESVLLQEVQTPEPDEETLPDETVTISDMEEASGESVLVETAPLESALVETATETNLPLPSPTPPIPTPPPELPVSTFKEVWAYLSSGLEEYLKTSYPITDLAYFGAEFDSYGRLTTVPRRSRINFYQGRVHLVVCCNSRALTHFILEPGSAARRQAIADLLAAAKDFDGLQIDFELVPERDGNAFLLFLRELRNNLGNKWLTVALPARTRTISNDVYDYAAIYPLVDRILVMAYDEHWSTSQPGPIASSAWGRNIATYAMKTIGAEKLIMGLPFYGRTWGDYNPNRAFYFSGIERIKRENGVSEVGRAEGVPWFSYDMNITITSYYEDAQSLSEKMEQYRALGVNKAGFWTLGQETPDIWDLIRLATN